MHAVQAVCFDAYGTLCRITERHNPFELLFAQLGVDMREAARLAMTTDTGFAELASTLGDTGAAKGILPKLDAELGSVRLFDDVIESLGKLVDAGFRLWVISNLAAPYGEPVRRLLGSVVSGYSFSFEIGSMKPDPAIFAHACSGLAMEPSQVLMVGDSKKSDVDGSQAFGMQAVWLKRGSTDQWPQSVGSLKELVDHLTVSVP